jgi:DNA (cytosine-5)-methyltransferase 1
MTNDNEELSAASAGSKPLTFGSLFAGIGGFDLGLERAGMVCKWQVEIDDYASRVLAKHWPHVQRWGDVRTFPPGPADEWRVDLVCAGVPCQPVSHAGKQKGVDDERWMWGEALRVVADIKPTFFVAENPIGILNHDGGRAFRGVLGALSSVGYVCEWHVIAASDLGSPHRRERVWLVAYTDRVSCTTGQPRRTAGGLHSSSEGSSGREDQGEAWSVAGCCGADSGERGTVDQVSLLRELLLHDSPRARSRLPVPSDRGVGVEPVQAKNYVADPDRKGLEGSVLEHASEGLLGPCSGTRRDEKEEVPETAAGWWEVEPDVGRVAHGIPNRVDRLRCLGNAVVPQVVEVIGRAIVARG